MAEPYGLQQTDTAVDPLTPESYIARQRIRGWLGALGSAGVTPVVVKHPKMPYRPETDGYAALTMLLDADPQITGVLCFSDRFATGVLAAALDRGLAVPGDLSIVGFDDSPVASNSRPPLTTVRQDLAEKGHAAAEGLIAAVHAKAGHQDPVIAGNTRCGKTCGAARRTRRPGQHRSYGGPHAKRIERSGTEAFGCPAPPGWASPGVSLRGFPRTRPDPVQSMQSVLVQLHGQRTQVGMQLVDGHRSDDR